MNLVISLSVAGRPVSELGEFKWVLKSLRREVNPVGVSGVDYFEILLNRVIVVDLNSFHGDVWRLLLFIVVI